MDLPLPSGAAAPGPAVPDSVNDAKFPRARSESGAPRALAPASHVEVREMHRGSAARLAAVFVVVVALLGGACGKKKSPVVRPMPEPPPSVTAPATPPTAVVRVASEPPGAAVVIDGKVVGTTPATLSLVLPRRITLTLAGHRPAHRLVSSAGELLVRLITTRPAPSTRLLDQ